MVILDNAQRPHVLVSKSDNCSKSLLDIFNGKTEVTVVVTNAVRSMYLYALVLNAIN